MLVKQYLKELIESIKGSEQEKCLQVKRKIIDLICGELNIFNDRDIYYKNNFNDYDPSFFGDTIVNIRTVLFLLGLETDDYFKYVLLEGLTEGKYIPRMVTAIVRFLEENVYFRFQFSTQGLMGYVTEPKLHVELSAQNKLSINNLVYEEFINGMETVDDACCILSDVFCLFRPDSCLDMLKTKIFLGNLKLEYTKDKVLDIVPRWYNDFTQQRLIDLILSQTVFSLPSSLGYPIAYTDYSDYITLDDRLRISISYIDEYYNILPNVYS